MKIVQAWLTTKFFIKGGGGGGGERRQISYIGMCSVKGYGFLAWTEIGYRF